MEVSPSQKKEEFSICLLESYPPAYLFSIAILRDNFLVACHYRKRNTSGAIHKIVL